MNLALDRIIGMEQIHSKYIETEIEWHEYFDEIIGVSKIQDVEETKIILEFTPEQAPYILTKPLHGSQRTWWKDEQLVVEIKVIPNYELETVILSFGEKVKVIEPKSLVQKIEMRVEKLANNYK